jgi:DNA modification methylase
VKLKVTELKSNPNNPRFIKDDKFKKLVQSLKDFPEMAEVREVVINKDYIILGGNMRFKAMQEAGWKEIPVKVVDWTPEQQREFIIKDNVSGGEWDWDILANEWDSDLLDEWGLDLPANFGDDEVEEDEAPEVSSDPPVSILGEVYQLGRHRVMCGDSTDKSQVAKLLNGKQADMVFTDPPYGVDYSSRVDKDRRKPWGTILNDDLKDETLREFLYDSCNDLTKPKYVCCNWQSVADFMLALGKPNSFIVWDKQSIGLGAGYRNQHEIILFYGKLNHNSESNVWTIKRDSTYEHPTQKPVAIPARAIKNSSIANDIVLDIFLGSGSTLIACEQTDRVCYGMELDPRYVDVIRKRWAKYTHPDTWEEEWEALTPIVNSGTKQVDDAIS